MLDCLQLFFRSRDTLEGLLLKRLEAEPSLAIWIEAELALSPYAKKKKSGGRPAVDPEPFREHARFLLAGGRRWRGYCKVWGQPGGRSRNVDCPGRKKSGAWSVCAPSISIGACLARPRDRRSPSQSIVCFKGSLGITAKIKCICRLASKALCKRRNSERDPEPRNS